jgi:Amidohydrolase
MDCSSLCQLGPPANTVETYGPEPRLKLMNGRLQRDTRTGPLTYADVGRVARAYVKAAPERMVWSSDWPHPTEHADAKPNDAILFDLLADWAPDEAIRNRILVDNPAALCGVRLKRAQGQIYPPLSGALKQPTDSGKSVFGNQSTAFGKKIAKAIVTKKIT